MKRERLLRQSVMLGIGSAVSEELATVADECRQPDWDGFGAAPVSQDALRTVSSLLEALPVGTPRPTIGAEPDGHLTLEWHRSQNRTLSVSVSPEGDLHYSALIGPDRQCATQAFVGDLPAKILELVHRACADG